MYPYEVTLMNRPDIIEKLKLYLKSGRALHYGLTLSATYVYMHALNFLHNLHKYIHILKYQAWVVLHSTTHKSSSYGYQQFIDILCMYLSTENTHLCTSKLLLTV